MCVYLCGMHLDVTANFQFNLRGAKNQNIKSNIKLSIFIIFDSIFYTHMNVHNVAFVSWETFQSGHIFLFLMIFVVILKP